MICECLFHHYHVVHIYNKKIYDHSQGTSVLKGKENIKTFPSHFYKHGMTAEELEFVYDRAIEVANRSANET